MTKLPDTTRILLGPGPRLVALLLASLERTAAFGSRPRSVMVEHV